LPDLEKKILGDSKPDEFNSSNKDSILRSLKYSNSSISKEDVLLVEKEIDQASSFILVSYDFIDQLKEALLKAVVYERPSTPVHTEEPTDRSIDKEKKINELMSAAIRPEDKLSKGERIIVRNDLLGYYYLGNFELKIYKCFSVYLNKLFINFLKAKFPS
jgi:hypothetical protein